MDLLAVLILGAWITIGLIIVGRSIDRLHDKIDKLGGR